MHGIRRTIGLGRRVAMASTSHAGEAKALTSFMDWGVNVRASHSERDSIALSTFLTGTPYETVNSENRVRLWDASSFGQKHQRVLPNVTEAASRSHFHARALAHTLDPLAFLISSRTAASDPIADRFFETTNATMTSMPSVPQHLKSSISIALPDETIVTQTTRETIQAISIKKRRRKAMNKHKWKKLRRSVRNSVRYNKERRRKSGPMREKQE
ncbi:hypothetical protein HDU80_004434 [Chytriomyces hyalinus]|nr:hypothetical protein HDU80_004434 [Chytriomyces hyalinus]